MEKLKYIPLGLFSVYFLKISLQTATLSDAAILLILGSIAAFYEFKSNDKKLLELESQISEIQKTTDLKLKDLDGVKSQVASIKLANNYKTQQAKF